MTALRSCTRSGRCLRNRIGRVKAIAAAKQATVAGPANVAVKEYGAHTLRGTTRKVNEDRWDVKLTDAEAGPGELYAYASVFDGHGGPAAADYLQKNLFSELLKGFDPSAPEATLTETFLEFDEKLLRPGGFMGLGERGVGGSKCGATSATALLYKASDGTTLLCTANVGDSRVLLVRGGKAIELYEEHVPDSEPERIRIEKRNPNPKDPMVKFINGTWRVGNPWGYLALSRAFGDAFLKAGYTAGRGLVAEPYVAVQPLSSQDSWIVVSSDGLHSEESRGGGGGLDNQDVADLLLAGGDSSCEALAKKLVEAAVDKGSTDDVTVVLFRLGGQ